MKRTTWCRAGARCIPPYWRSAKCASSKRASATSPLGSSTVWTACCSLFDELAEALEFEEAGALRLPALPEEVLQGVREVLEYAGELLMALPRDALRKRLLKSYFTLLRFARIAEALTPEYAVLPAAEREMLRLRLFCLHPGPLLRRRVARSTAAIFFSATLSPARYFRELLGARDWCEHLSLPSPFPPENRLYLHVPEVSTRYLAREATRPSVARVLLDTARAHRGNYLAFFPSFAYLGAVWARDHDEPPGRYPAARAKTGPLAGTASGFPLQSARPRRRKIQPRPGGDGRAVR